MKTNYERLFMKFHPHWWCKNGPMQTVASMYFPRVERTLTHNDHIITLSDGDSSLVHETNPYQTKDLFIIVHGLTGSAESRCVNRLANHFFIRRCGVVRVNLRGCGAGKHLSKEICHAGRSDDLLRIVRYFSKRYPKTRIHCIGFSLGGNLLLKMASSSNKCSLDQLASVVAVSPPIDLQNCVRYLGEAPRRWLDQYFVKTLIKLSREHHLPYKIPDKKIKSLYEFDNLVTSKIAGFSNADEYYQYSSSIDQLNRLICPTLIMSAKDDPCVNFSIFNRVDNHPMVSFIGTEYGGHGAYLGHTGKANEQWLERVIEMWLENNKLLEST